MTGAGDLRWTVRFDRQTATADAAGGVLSDWSNLSNGSFTRKAQIMPQRGGETVQAQRLDSVQPYIIKVRFDSLTRTLTSAWRAVELLNGVEQRRFALKTVEDMERDRQFITLQAVQGVADS